MAFMPINAMPGVSKSVSDYASGKPMGYQSGRMAQGRYTDMDHCRFVAGFPEKLGGWAAIGGFPGVTGIPRAHKTWKDNNSNPRLAIGTESHLYSWDGTTLLDITPLQTIKTGTLGTNPLNTASNSTTVTVSDTGATLKNGDWVLIQGATTFNNVTINGWYSVSGVNAGVGYNITAGTIASASGTGGGSAVTYGYPRITLANNSIITQSGSAVVEVQATAHNQVTGNYVNISGATAVGGITLSGQYQVTVTGNNTYNVTASSTASSTATGGGSNVQVEYLIQLSVLSLSNAVTYGQGVYGTGPYGYSQSTTATSTTGWTLDRYGYQLLSCPIGGTIYVYDPSIGGTSYPLLNAPTNVQAMFVTAERFVVALGTASSAMQMAWADQNNYTVWTSLVTNTANSGRTVQGGTTFIGGAPVRDGVALAITDKAAFQLNYSGDNFVYDSPELSDNASIVSPHAIGVLGEAAYWMSNSEFWFWNGTVQPLPSDDIRDFVFRNINLNYITKSWVYVNRAKKEIWFSYPSAASTEIDSYVIWHTDQQCWSKGTWSGLSGSGARTAGVDADLFNLPLLSDVNGMLYQHEFGTDDNGSALNAYLTFSPVDVSNGDQNVDVFGFIPDFSRLSNSINLTVNTRLYPQDANTVSGPYTITATDSTPNIDLRCDGKMVGFELDSSVVGGDFRFGVPRLNVQPSGARL